MSRSVCAVIFLFLLQACGGQQFSLFPKSNTDTVISKTRLLLCPDFDIELCKTDVFPDSLEGMNPVYSKLVYNRVLSTLHSCANRTKAYQAARERCKEKALEIAN